MVRLGLRRRAERYNCGEGDYGERAEPNVCPAASPKFSMHARLSAARVRNRNGFRQELAVCMRSSPSARAKTGLEALARSEFTKRFAFQFERERLVQQPYFTSAHAFSDRASRQFDWRIVSTSTVQPFNRSKTTGGHGLVLIMCR